MAKGFQDEPTSKKADYSPPPATPDMPVEVVVYSAAYTRRMNRLKICLLITYILIVTFVILVRKDVIGKDTAANVKSGVTGLFDRDKDKADDRVPTMTYPAVADTYLQGGDFSEISFGTMDTFYVQGGGADAPAAYALLKFDLNNLPSQQEREFWLQLDHVESVASEDSKHEIQVIRLPDPKVDIESLTFRSFPSTGNDKIDGPTFTVSADDPNVQVDITALVEDDSLSRLLRGQTRQLQPFDSVIVLMLRSLSTNGVASVFRSREATSDDQRPKIALYLPPTPAPSRSPTPSPTNPPTTPEPTPEPPTDPPTTPPPTPIPPTEPPTTPSPTPRPPTDPPTTPIPTPRPVTKTAAPANTPSPNMSVTSAPIPTTPQPTLSSVATNEPSDGTASSPQPSNPPIPTFSPSNAPIQPPTDSPSPQPTKSPRPSLSPTNCADYVSPFLIPPLVNMDGAIENEFPKGAVSYVFQKGSQVTVRITQLWSDQNVSWIAPYFIVLSQGGFVCPKTRDIAPGSTLEATLDCFNTEVVFRILVNDESLIPENDDDGAYELPPECREDDDDLPGQMVLYTFLVKCNPPPVQCNDNA